MTLVQADLENEGVESLENRLHTGLYRCNVVAGRLVIVRMMHFTIPCDFDLLHGRSEVRRLLMSGMVTTTKRSMASHVIDVICFK